MVKRSWFDRHVRKINKLLLVFIVLINGYVIVSPFLPQVTYQVAQAVSKTEDFESEEVRAKIDRSYDHIMVPRMRLDEKIWVGDNEKLVNMGVWQVPHTSTPDKGSNTVLVGHRFSYKDPAVFYHLDKVQPGDLIVVVWDGQIYTYRARDQKIVKPTDVYVEDATDEDILTLYTCHPLWSTRERLVVTAVLEGVE